MVFAIRILLLLASTNLSSADYPLKKDNSDPGSVGLGVAARTAPRASTLSLSRTIEVIPVSMEVLSNELSVYFQYAVGGAYVTVEDTNGAILISTVVDTTSDLEFYFPIDELDGGTYTLRVSYGATKLKGEFKL